MTGLVVLVGLLALGYFLAPSVAELAATLRQNVVAEDAPADDSPMATITIDVRPDP